MYRQGKYTKKRNPLALTRQFLRRRWTWYKSLPRWKKVAYPLIPVILLMVFVPILTYAYFYNDIGDKERLLNRNNTGVVMTDINDEAFFSSGRSERRELVPLDQMADSIKKAVIAAEDKDFYEHSGFSPLSIIRASYSNLVARDITGGGSTITQQLAKNTLLTDQQTILRKYQELTIAMAIEQRYSKDEILEMYLNSVYYGENSFGIEDAAKNYFNKIPAQLSLAESSMLIGVLPAPSAYSPISGDPELAKERQTTVLTRMERNGYITEAERTAALGEVLAYAPQRSPIDNDAPHFTEMILAQLYEKYGEERVERSGYQVKTTLDLSLQRNANENVAAQMNYIASRGGSNAGLIAIDPKTGEIRALVGSADYNNEEFGKVNMTATPRQPGSSFKSIYYADALARGEITPATILRDERTDFGGYVPQNASRTFYGDVTVRQALSWSLNIPAVKVMQKEGVDNAVEASKKLGITTLNDDADYGLSLALGSAEVPLDEMTNAYAAFANSGKIHDKVSIRSIENKFGDVIFNSSSKEREAISEQGAYLLSSILSDNQARSGLFGSSLNVLGTDRRTKTVAVKTGTTDDARDAWTIGYTPDIAIGVWVGNNDNETMRSGGADMAGPIWRKTIGHAIGTASPSFTQPAGVVRATVCINSKQITDVFLSNNVPDQCQKQTEQPKEEEQDEEEPEPVVKCTVAGKRNLTADDPNCREDMCTIEGKTNLAANDPNCKKDTASKDSDNDGVADNKDSCPGTPSGTSVDEDGCPVEQNPVTPNASDDNERRSSRLLNTSKQ